MDEDANANSVEDDDVIAEKKTVREVSMGDAKVVVKDLKKW